MRNSITTELKDYKIFYGNTGFRIELDYTLEEGSFPNFSRNGRIKLLFYKREGYRNHFVRYSNPRFLENFTIFIAPEEYLSMVDLLRNESPVYFYCLIDYMRSGEVPDGRHEVRTFSISTDKERIGEDDLDEST